MKKNLIFLAVCLTAIFAFTSCNGNKVDDPTLDVEYSDTVIPSKGQATFPVTIKSNTDWEITKVEADDWFTVEPMTGSKDGNVNINIQANTDEDERTSTLTVKAGGTLTRNIVLKQAGYSATLGVTFNNEEILWDGGEVKFKIQSNVEWTITSSESWAVVNPATGNGNKDITVKVTESNSSTTSNRTATLTIAAKDDATLTKEIDIVQLKGSDATILGTWNFNGYHCFFDTEIPFTAELKYYKDDRYYFLFPGLTPEGEVYSHVRFYVTYKSSVEGDNGKGALYFNASKDVIDIMDGEEYYQTVIGYKERGADAIKFLTLSAQGDGLGMAFSADENAIIFAQQVNVTGENNQDLGPHFFGLGTYYVNEVENTAYYNYAFGEITATRGTSGAPQNINNAGRTLTPVEMNMFIPAKPYSYKSIRK